MNPLLMGASPYAMNPMLGASFGTGTAGAVINQGRTAPDANQGQKWYPGGLGTGTESPRNAPVYTNENNISEEELKKLLDRLRQMQANGLMPQNPRANPMPQIADNWAQYMQGARQTTQNLNAAPWVMDPQRYSNDQRANSAMQMPRSDMFNLGGAMGGSDPLASLSAGLTEEQVDMLKGQLGLPTKQEIEDKRIFDQNMLAQLGSSGG
jgi:hypothetical protein